MGLPANQEGNHLLDTGRKTLNMLNGLGYDTSTYKSVLSGPGTVAPQGEQGQGTPVIQSANQSNLFN